MLDESRFCFAVKLTLFLTLFGITSVAVTTNHRGRFQRHFQLYYHQWFVGFRHMLTDSHVECSLRCVRITYRIGFHYDGKTCNLIIYSWLSNNPYTLTNLDSSKFYFFNEQGAKDYIFDRVQGFSFKFHTNPMTWQDALDQCQKENATLVSTKSKAKNDFIHKIRNGKAIYIGASDIKTEGDWRWTDGTPLTYEDFNDGQPNNYDGNYPSKDADCCAMASKWADNYCGHPDRFICERAE